MAITTTTSGDTSIIQYNQITLIEMAAERCGKMANTLSSETIFKCQRELAMLINTLVNKGIPLWTIDKQIYGLSMNQNILQFSPDTVDLVNVLYRFNTLPTNGIPSASTGNAANAFDQNTATFCQQTAPNGFIAYDFLAQTTITSVGLLMHGTATLNPVYEYSNDLITWTEVIGPAPEATVYQAGQWYWQDVSFPKSAIAFRVRETSGGILDVTEVVFSTAPNNQIILSRINRDDYQNLPNPNINGRPLQFWFDRQIIPQAWVWPASGYDFNSLVVWRRRIIQNVGNFTNSIEFPNRFLDYIIAALAVRFLVIIPGVNIPLYAPILKAMLDDASTITWNEERDNSQFFMAPMIGGYTRSN